MENRTIKMVVCDIDDTLIHGSLHLSSKIINLIQTLQKEKVHFTFATGRMPYRVETLAKEAGLQIPYVANNGSILYDRGKMVYSKLLPAALLKESLQPFMAENPDFTVIFSYLDRECPLRQTPWIKARLHKYKGYDETLGEGDEVWNQEVHKIYVVDDHRSGLMSQVARTLKALEDKCSYFQYGEYSMEIVAPGCTKAAGVTRLMEYMQVDKSQVMAIGDHTNDIEVVSLAGLGVAVANADSRLKAVADYITSEAYEDGVIEGIHRFVLTKEGTEDGRDKD